MLARAFAFEYGRQEPNDGRNGARKSESVNQKIPAVIRRGAAPIPQGIRAESAILRRMDRSPGIAVIPQKRLFDFLDCVLRRTAGGGADNLLLDHALLRPLLAAFATVQTFAGKIAELHSPGTQPRMALVPLARCRRSESGSVSVVGDTLARRIRSAKYHELAALHRVMRNDYRQRRSVVAESASNPIIIPMSSHEVPRGLFLIGFVLFSGIANAINLRS